MVWYNVETSETPPHPPPPDYPDGAFDPTGTGLQPGCPYPIHLPPALPEGNRGGSASDLQGGLGTDDRTDH